MPMPRTDVPPAWDERTILTAFLDYVHATVHAKCEHLAEVDARRAPLPGSPLMILSGLVNHLRWVEYYWFQVMLVGEEDHGPGPRRIPTGRCASPWKSRSRSCWRNTRRSAPATETWSPPWTWTPRPSGPSVVGRDAALDPAHLVEETARHNGHHDLPRELADGVTGT
jgi:hypothetical protein